MVSAAMWPCIGRSTQSALIMALLRDPQPKALVVAGPAGSGKTHLVRHCVAAAQAEGIPIRMLDGASWGVVAVDRSEAPAAVEGRIDAPAGGSPRPIPIRPHTSSPVTVVEDVHQLDEHTARALYSACAARTGRWICTMRTGEDVPAPTVAMWADGLAERVDLPPLSRNEIDEILVAVLGGAVDESMTTRLSQRCQGNLLYLRELVLDAVAEGVIFEDGGLWRATHEWRVPPRLAEIIAQSLHKLSTSQRETLETVAFAGSLGSAELDALVRTDEVEALERLKLVRTTMEGRRLSVQVGDPLLAEVLVNDMPGIRARALARHLAELVEATGCRRDGDILKVAMWRLSGGGGSPATLLAGAKAARCAHNYSLAGRLVQLAIAEGAGFDAELLAAKLIGLQGGDRECQQALLELAARTVAEEQQAQVRLALDEHQAIWMGLSSSDESHAAEPGTSQGAGLSAQLRATRAGTLLLTDGPRAACAEATALLSDPQDGVRTWAAIVLGYGLARVGRTQDALEVSAAGLTSHTQLEWFSGWDRWWHAFNRCEALLQAGRLAEACTLARTRYEAALTSPSPEEQAFFGWQLCKIHTEYGALTTAAHYGKVAAALFRDLGRSAYVQATQVSLVLAWARAGHAAHTSRPPADVDLKDSAIVSLAAVDATRARGWMAASSGDRSGARELFWAGQQLGAKSGDLVAEASVLHDLVVLGDTSVLGRLRELDAQTDSELVAARTRHAAAALAKDPDLLSQASHGFAQLGARLAAAEAAADAAVRWRQRDQPRRAAAEERRAHEFLSACEGAHALGVEAIGARAVLSPGEHDAAALAVTGRSNGEIAEALQLSKRTVENRLQRVYSKLGITGRDDLAVALGI
jgi:DNA-binding CsgD family transcriptional regulator/RecA/RadA recombinase